MGRRKALIVSALGAFAVAIGLFCYTISVSKAFSYLGNDPKACINCHVMNTQYATWEHSAHGRMSPDGKYVATCNDCHVPHGGVEKYIAKARDGLHHAEAFTFGGYAQAIQISKDGAKRVQKNCVTCHASLARTLIADSKINGDKNHRFDEEAAIGDRYCWSCHRGTPHGSVRALATTPNNLGVRELK